MTAEAPAPPAPDGADPSMEEILASIRRILNDDETAATPAAAAEAATAEDDVLILDPSMLVGEPEPDAAEEPDAEEPNGPKQPDAEERPEAAEPGLLADPVPAPQAGPMPAPQAEPVPAPQAGPMPAPQAEPVPAPQAGPPQQEMEAVTFIPPPDPFDLPAPTPDLVAPEAAAAAAYSVGNLVRTLAAGRATQVYGGGPTLEDMVRAELRPLLKEWLDTNLPPMVERLVRVEIERVVGRAVP
jgi:cell pole-organizing protein PopZ